ncbi:hypothetical protein N8I74_11340 [Chitiniphilus purpureus]|uniref:CNP1-like uncharacterized domain-containing protein n=1 Tax=Chitiniphilus purpureus TaxID=2981137 RepID=A0ABY6DKD5_9NEIS|nr:hypothetical protein [Chitiniphilus sp. CD1]UXY13916.1 hypothetical protein N8I74_11340 [Chitiniphilus sp. CD1]
MRKLAALLLVALVVFLFISRPLIPDKELIDYFENNKAELYRLARSYQDYLPPPGKPHAMWGDIHRAELDALGIKLMTSTILVQYPQDPKGQADYQALIPNYGQVYRYGAISIRKKGKVEGIRCKFSRGCHEYAGLIGGVMWKRLIYFRFPPQIRGKEMRIAMTPGKLAIRQITPLSYDSIGNWQQRHSCLYKRLDPHWFIRKCRA